MQRYRGSLDSASFRWSFLSSAPDSIVFFCVIRRRIWKSGSSVIQRGDFGRRKDKIQNALPAGKRREMGKGKYKGKQARVGGRYKKNWLSHDNQSLLTLNLIPWKTLQRYGVPRDNASLRHAFLLSLTSVMTKCNLWNAKSTMTPRFHPHYLPFSCWCKEANAFGRAQRSNGGVSWAW